MDTSKMPHGRLTDKIMLRVSDKLPELSTHEYNRTHEAVRASLIEECEDIPVKLHPDIAVPKILGGFRSL